MTLKDSEDSARRRLRGRAPLWASAWRSRRVSGAALFLAGTLAVDVATPEQGRTQPSTPPAVSSNGDIEAHLDRRFEVLRSFLRRVESEGRDALQDSGAGVEDALAFLATWERSRSGLARGIQARTSDPDVQAVVRAFQDAAHVAQQRRLELPMQELAYTEGTMPAAEFTDRLATLIEAHETAREAGRDLEQIRGEFDLPAMLVIYGPDEVETTDDGAFSAEYLVENLMSHDARQLEFTLEALRAAEDLPVTFSPARLPRLPPRGTEAVLLQGTVPADVDPLMAQLHLRGERVRESVMLTVREGG